MGKPPQVIQAPPPPPAGPPPISEADREALYAESLNRMNQALYGEPTGAGSDVYGGLLGEQLGNFAGRGLLNASFVPVEQARTLESAQQDLANIRSAPDYTSAIMAQNTLQQGMNTQLEAARQMAEGKALLNRSMFEQGQQSGLDYSGINNLFSPHEQVIHPTGQTTGNNASIQTHITGQTPTGEFNVNPYAGLNPAQQIYGGGIL